MNTSEILQRYEESVTAYNRAAGLMARGRYEEAEPILREALAQYPRQLLIDGEPDTDPSIKGSFDTLFAGIKAMLEELKSRMELPGSAPAAPKEETPRAMRTEKPRKETPPEETPRVERPKPETRKPERRKPETPREVKVEGPSVPESYASLQDIVMRNMQLKAAEQGETPAFEKLMEKPAEPPDIEMPEIHRPAPAPPPVEATDLDIAKIETATGEPLEAQLEALEKEISLIESKVDEIATEAPSGPVPWSVKGPLPDKTPAARPEAAPILETLPDDELAELAGGFEDSGGQRVTVTGEPEPEPETASAPEPEPEIELPPIETEPAQPEAPEPELLSETELANILEAAAPKEREPEQAPAQEAYAPEPAAGRLEEPEFESVGTATPSTPDVSEENLSRIEDSLEESTKLKEEGEEEKPKRSFMASFKEIGVKAGYIFSRFKKEKKAEEPKTGEEAPPPSDLPPETAEETMPIPMEGMAEEILETAAETEPVSEKKEAKKKSKKAAMKAKPKKPGKSMADPAFKFASILLILAGIYFAALNCWPTAQTTLAYQRLMTIGDTATPDTYAQAATELKNNLGTDPKSASIVADLAAAKAATFRSAGQPGWGVTTLESLQTKAGVNSELLREELLNDYVAQVATQVKSGPPATALIPMLKAEQLMVTGSVSKEAAELTRRRMADDALRVYMDAVDVSLKNRDAGTSVRLLQALDAWKPYMDESDTKCVSLLRETTETRLLTAGASLLAGKQYAAAVTAMHLALTLSPSDANAKKTLAAAEAGMKAAQAAPAPAATATQSVPAAATATKGAKP